MSLSKNDLIYAINEFLPQYEYNYGRPYEVGPGVVKIIDTWFANKANTPLFRALEKHPAYNGRYQIVLNEDFHRKIDGREVVKFIDFMYEHLDFQYGENVVYKDTETEMDGAYVVSSRAEEIGVVYSKRLKIWIHRNDLRAVDGRYILTMRQVEAVDMFRKNPMQYLSEDMREIFNEAFPWLKAHAGAKASKVFRRICKETKLDKIEEFKQKWPRFADAINPLEVKRWTIISWNPIDYYTMSFGNDWQSCHTIDKTGKRGVGGQHYHGCYSSGTESYMLDESSVIVYTVDKSYNGNEFEYQPKMTRQVFNLSDDIIVQGRLYPQGNDVGAEENYATMRNIVQRVYTEALGGDNMWTVRKGTSACCKVIDTDCDATNYRDYESFDQCTVSRRAGWGGQLIRVGHAPICPKCGNTHDQTECIMCEDCMEEEKYCYHCNEVLCEDDGYIEAEDGNCFCDAYCAGQEGYVYCNNDCTWRPIEDDGVIYDEYDGNYYHVGRYDSYIVTEDGNTYWCEEHAIEDGYEYVDGEEVWIPAYETRYCMECGRTVRADNYNDELGMCNDCAKEKEVTA